MSRGASYREPEEPEGAAAARRLRERAKAHHRAMDAQRARQAKRKGRGRWVVGGVVVVTVASLAARSYVGEELSHALAIVGFLGVITLIMAGVIAVGLKNRPNPGDARPGPDVHPPGV